MSEQDTLQGAGIEALLERLGHQSVKGQTVMTVQRRAPMNGHGLRYAVRVQARGQESLYGVGSTLHDAVASALEDAAEGSADGE